MTEAKWLSCTDPREMLSQVWGPMNDPDILGSRMAWPPDEDFDPEAINPSMRLLRLFACACCRHDPSLIGNELVREAVAIAEAEADRTCDPEAPRELLEALQSLLRSHQEASPAALRCHSIAFNLLMEDGDSVAWGEPDSGFWLADQPSGLLLQADLLRDILGNPFRPVTVDPSALASGTVTMLAKSIYAEGRFEDLPILADALEEAGCTDADILDHCRGSGPHVRGCWAVDILLGKS